MRMRRTISRLGGSFTLASVLVRLSMKGRMMLRRLVTRACSASWAARRSRPTCSTRLAGSNHSCKESGMHASKPFIKAALNTVILSRGLLCFYILQNRGAKPLLQGQTTKWFRPNSSRTSAAGILMPLLCRGSSSSILHELIRSFGVLLYIS